LKPSAMKNELNAAIHFTAFLKRQGNLAVDNPALYASLENTKDTTITFQVCGLKCLPTSIVSKF